MKKLFLIILSIFLIGCIDPNQRFTGYIVCKEYIPEHMSDRSPRIISYSSVITVPHTTINNKPYKIKEKWVFYIANKKEIIIKSVSEKLFNSKRCGEKIKIKRY